MNKQGPNGIEWLNYKRSDGTTRYGYTWNPIAGCNHGCRWEMPDGTTAICYAELIASRVAQAHYPHGFAHHYWHPERLPEPLKVKEPAHIFPDSMADLFGAWVPIEQRKQMFDVMRQADWHSFLSLTKAAPQILKHSPEELPRNLWLGASSPPDQFMGQPLHWLQQEKMLAKSLQVLRGYPDHITWISFEPLSQDYADIVAGHPGALKWAVIGAASNGPRTYQPNPEHVSRLLEVLDVQGVPVFFKGNLRKSPAAQPWREAFPETAQ